MNLLHDVKFLGISIQIVIFRSFKENSAENAVNCQLNFTMKNLLFATFLLVGTLTAQSDSTQKTIKNLDIEPKHSGNEIAIANFFPMIFQQSWGNNSGVIYRYHIKKHPIALRAQMSGNLNRSTREAFDNNDFINKVPDEFNQLTSKYNTWNLGIGIQQRFIGSAVNGFSVYHFIDAVMGGNEYTQISMNGGQTLNGSNGKTILSFNTIETIQNSRNFGIDYGLGLNYHIIKNIHVQIETKINFTNSSQEYKNIYKTITYDLPKNEFYVSNMNEVKNNPKTQNVGFNITPLTTLLFAYRF